MKGVQSIPVSFSSFPKINIFVELAGLIFLKKKRFTNIYKYVKSPWHYVYILRYTTWGKTVHINALRLFFVSSGTNANKILYSFVVKVSLSGHLVTTAFLVLMETSYDQLKLWVCCLHFGKKQKKQNFTSKE